jgi:hypothetical protein
MSLGMFQAYDKDIQVVSIDTRKHGTGFSSPGIIQSKCIAFPPKLAKFKNNIKIAVLVDVTPFFL